MAILQECVNCRARCSLKRTECSKCGTVLPTKRIYWARYTIKDKGKRKEIWKRLGPIPFAMAQSWHDRHRQADREEELFPKQRIPTLGEIWAEYEFRLELQSPGWRKTVKGFVKRFKQEWGESTLANELTVQDIEALRRKLWQEGKAFSTIDRFCAAGQSAWNHHSCKLENPFAQIKFFRPDNRVTEYLSKEEEERLLTVARKTQPMLYEMLVLALATGLRMSNLLSLRWDQVDWDEGLIQVRQKGNRAHTIAITDEIRDLLETIPPTGTVFFWINPKTNKPYGNLTKTFRNLLKAAGIRRRFVWHWLRHTTGSRIVQAGLGLQAAKELLGHRDLSTTMRYAHLDPEYLKEAAKAASPNVVTVRVTTATKRLKQPRKSKA